MHLFKLAAAAGALAVSAFLVTGVAPAQNQPTPRVRPAPPTDSPPRPDATRQSEREAGFYRASEIIGTTVKGEGGESLGQIQDLLIDRRNQQIQYFILGEGAAIDARPDQPQAQSSSLTVIPWSVARPQFGTAESRFVSVPFAPQRLQQAPTLTWQEIQTGPAVWASDVDRFFGVSAGVRERGVNRRDREIEIDDGAARPRGRGRIEVEPNGDVRGRGGVEVERDGDVRPEGRIEVERDGGVRPEGRIEVERDGDVEVKPND